MDIVKDQINMISWPHAIVVAALYVSTLAFYRLFLHPLSQFPGPKLAAITRWYEGYYDIIQGGQYTYKISQLHKKYGMVPKHHLPTPFVDCESVRNRA